MRFLLFVSLHNWILLRYKHNVTTDNLDYLISEHKQNYDLFQICNHPL